jgi:hypothetical protein
METRLPVQGHPAIVWRDVPVHLARPKKHRGKQGVFVVHSIVISDLLVGKKLSVIFWEIIMVPFNQKILEVSKTALKMRTIHLFKRQMWETDKT